MTNQIGVSQNFTYKDLESVCLAALLLHCRGDVALCNSISKEGSSSSQVSPGVLRSLDLTLPGCETTVGWLHLAEAPSPFSQGQSKVKREAA